MNKGTQLGAMVGLLMAMVAAVGIILEVMLMYLIPIGIGGSAIMAASVLILLNGSDGER